jgi:hypothetical protein
VTLIFINEFSDRNCPVTALVYDLQQSLSREDQVHCSQLNLRTRYRPGGFQIIRILSLLAMVVLSPFAIVWHRILTFISRKKLTIVLTTLPPMLHWVVLPIAFFLRVPVIFWYMDAHPELEMRILQRSNLQNLNRVILAIDKFILKLSSTFVVLDSAMKNYLCSRRSVPDQKIALSPPWSTYMTPTKPLRGFQSDHQSLKLLYAGNYGFAHDISPLAQMLTEKTSQLPTGNQIKIKIEITIVGMNAKAQETFVSSFANSKVKITCLPRFERIADLLKLFDQFDFGIVSLRNDGPGTAAPSKSFTYISQGLPILYLGPEGSFADDLVRDGYGLDLAAFAELITSTDGKWHSPKIGTTLPDPKLKAIKVFEDILGL